MAGNGGRSYEFVHETLIHVFIFCRVTTKLSWPLLFLKTDKLYSQQVMMVACVSSDILLG